ncbi:MAG: bacteriochlorophyll 4-vinyl reductase [Pseudomonadota bacterium]
MSAGALELTGGHRPPAQVRKDRRASRSRAAPSAAHLHQVGPNAVIQLGHALRAAGGDALAQQVFDAAGSAHWLSDPPSSMVDERAVARLFHATRAALPQTADEVLAEAGRRTADYVAANRIPRLARLMLRVLPRGTAARALAKAVERHGWTFCGSGTVTFASTQRDRLIFAIEGNPIATPGCPWHVAVFERLFRRFATRAASVQHTTCCGRGARCCVIEITLRPTGKAGA